MYVRYHSISPPLRRGHFLRRAMVFVSPLLFLSYFAFGQWVELNPNLPRVKYYGIDFVGPDTGWTVGESGVILRTTNGGTKWTQVHSDVQTDLHAVDSYDGQTVIAVGNNGKIHRSTNAGLTWTSIANVQNRNLRQVQMVTDQVGWIVGHTATTLKTTDGGLTWQNQPTPFNTIDYWSVHFLNLRFGYIACNQGVVLKTTNGGESWQWRLAGDSYGLFAVYAQDSLRGVVGGFAGKLYYTTNSGEVWEDARVGTTIRAFAFVDSTLGYATGEGGFCITTNGGVSWTQSGSSSFPHGFALSFPTRVIGYGLGASQLEIRKSTDAGASFAGLVLNSDFDNISFPTERTGWLLNGSGGNPLLKTANAGETWIQQGSFSGTIPRSIEFLDTLVGFVGADFGRIYKTTNGGNTWMQKSVTGIRDTNSWFTDFYFTGNQTGWAATVYGNIVKTTDGGENWFAQRTQVDAISRIHFSDSLYGWAVGSSYRITRTSNGGSVWLNVSPPDYADPVDVYFMNRHQGWLVGGRTLYRTADTGRTWISVFSISDPVMFFKSLHWVTRSHAFLTASYKVFETRDSGATWVEVQELRDRNLRRLSFPTSSVGFGAGVAGIIMRYRDTTMTGVDPEIKPERNDFDLYQNYPNPFNPDTKIKFVISNTRSFVSLKIFDVLGREIQTLLNEEMNQGEHEVSIQPDKLQRYSMSSGVYFYQLTEKNKNGMYVKTRKMIYLR